jgi:hypothetical protein
MLISTLIKNPSTAPSCLPNLHLFLLGIQSPSQSCASCPREAVSCGDHKLWSQTDVLNGQKLGQVQIPASPLNHPMSLKVLMKINMCQTDTHTQKDQMN